MVETVGGEGRSVEMMSKEGHSWAVRMDLACHLAVYPEKLDGMCVEGTDRGVYNLRYQQSGFRS